MRLTSSFKRWQSRRNVELLLVALALLIGWSAAKLVDLATNTESPVDNSVFITVAVGAIALHILIRFLAQAADPFLFPMALLLTLLGLAMIHRLDIADEQRARQLSSTANAEAPSQLIWLLLGLTAVAAVLMFVRDHRWLQRFTYTAMVAGFALLLLPMLPVIGATVNGARLWVRIGGLSFQPAEVAKILLAIFFAGYLARARTSMTSIRSRWLGIGVPRGRDLGPIVAAWAISVLVLVAQRDLGTSLLFFGLFVGLLYIATGQRTWLAVGGLLFGAGAFLAYGLFSHVRLRATVWLDPFAYANDEGFQLVQAIYGFASGGLFGRGLGQGFAWLVPYAESDFILAAMGEELGYVGLAGITLIYAILVQRAFRIALSSRDDFGQLLAAGLAMVLALQLFVVFGGVTTLIPLTGLTAPFLAAGGSALVSNWLMIGLLLRISHTTNQLNAPAVSAG